MRVDPSTFGRRRTWAALLGAAARAGLSPERVADLADVEVGHTDCEPVYEENKLTLYRYAPDERAHRTPIVLVYALINRPYILDLQPDRSVVRRLLEAGFEVYLLDWGRPSALDRSLGLVDYVDRYLDNCIDAVRERAGVEAVHLFGYCMGGTMSVIYAATHPDRVRTLSLMATPVALEETGGVLERWAGQFDPDAVVEAFDNAPAELLAAAFSMLDPIDQHLGKYVRLYEQIEDEAFVENFLRMERWIWDGVDVPGEAFREFLTAIYAENRLIRGEYRLGEEPVDLGEIDVPLQQVVGEYDTIVPSEASVPLNDAVASEDARVREFPAGHVGLSVSRAAHADLWPDVCSWLAARDAE